MKTKRVIVYLNMITLSLAIYCIWLFSNAVVPAPPVIGVGSAIHGPEVTGKNFIIESYADSVYTVTISDMEFNVMHELERRSEKKRMSKQEVLNLLIDVMCLEKDTINAKF